MPRYCCVKGCSSNTRHLGIKFFRFPVHRKDRGQQMESITRRRRLAWVAAVRRKNITFNHISEGMRVCSLHFHKGQPAYEMMESDADWAPSLRLGHTDIKPTDCARCERRCNREQLRNNMQQETMPQQDELCDHHVLDNAEVHADGTEESITDQTGEAQSHPEQESDTSQCSGCITKSGEINRLREENQKLRQQLNRVKFSDGFFSENDTDKVRHYTGLPNYQTYMEVLSFFMSVTSYKKTLLTPFQMLLLTLMRLRLDVSVYVLSDLFLVSTSTVYRVFNDTVSHLYSFLRHSIIWPDRDTLRKVMPHQFVQSFGNRVAVIIDCFEIFTERPSNVKACAQMFSSYKHNHTMKYLIGITPKGAICFLSKGWGGRTSDKHITLNSGFLNKLMPGDIVLADRGFDIQENVGMLCAEVKVPAFTKGMSQLDAKDVEETRKIAHLRIHVERVIGNVNQKYKLLAGTIPISLILPCEGEDVTLLDKVVTVCCALTNLCPTVCK
ncbi:uncharacterized protein LOC115396593 isoform X1 [Salarias fasciatus]|uniref:Uncharacterized LOC115396593 n=2 Tax=Salarias fasciatus TaxID=181472 RepID=A0A672GH51_SALFA|nr:uncharacterized protein LOC115396593 isoform X1 [Salarias fasciatus]